MKVETKLQIGLVNYLEKEKLSNISVISLCKFTKVNRQTFYYHYRDIMDVVESLFLKETIILKSSDDYSLLLDNLFEFINKRKNFIVEIVGSYANESFERFVFSYIFKNLKDSLEIKRMISNLTTKELSFWIASKFKEKKTSLKLKLTRIYKYFLNDL